MTAHHESMKKHLDETIFSVSEFRAAQHGVILLVKTQADIREVRGPSRNGLPTPRDHRCFRTLSSQYRVVLVPLKFIPQAEWYIELFSLDGHWYSMSPYFGALPEIDSRTWDLLWRRPANTAMDHHQLFDTPVAIDGKFKGSAPVKSDSPNNVVSPQANR
jgi:hypothetical protein